MALFHTVATYLADRLGTDGEYILGEKPLKTLRLNQEARSTLLADYKRFPRSTDPESREWEKWLKGPQPTIAITFDQEAAVEHAKAIHLTVLHPLVRQAAGHLVSAEPVYVRISAESDDVSSGKFSFGLYSWRKQGVKVEERLVAVAEDPEVENALMTLLEHATDEGGISNADRSESEALKARHHSVWTAARANHIAANRELVQQRIESLTVSHRTRFSLLEDQVARADNDKIRRMKESELARARVSFEEQLKKLEQAANGGDIYATLVAFGVLSVMESSGR